VLVLSLGQRSDEAVDVVGFEVMGVDDEAAEVSDTEVRGAAGEDVGGGQGGQHRPSSRGGPGDRDAGRIGQAGGDESVDGGHGVLDVDDPPLPAQTVAPGAAEAGRTAVVDLEDADPLGG